MTDYDDYAVNASDDQGTDAVVEHDEQAERLDRYDGDVTVKNVPFVGQLRRPDAGGQTDWEDWTE